MMKKIVWAIFALVLTLASLPTASQAAPLKKFSWRAEYYDNAGLEGQPVSVRFEDAVNHDWGSGSPSMDIPRNRFSARWSVTRPFEEGTYLFLLTVDDGARVWLNGDLIIDAWNLGHKDNLRAEIFLEEGDQQLQVAYFENTGQALINFRWIQLGGADDIAGAWQGEYFDNKDLDGDPVVVRQDGAINFDWNSGPPDSRVARDNFSVRWTRSSYFEEGNYTLRIQHDDGMRIFADDENVYDSWFDQGVSYRTREIDLSEGEHTFRVEYYDHLGNAVAHMSIDEEPSDDNGGDGDGDGDKPGRVIIVDNKSSGFRWGGPLGNRFASQGGYGTGFYWTYNTRTTPVNFGEWQPELTAGDYELFAYIPAIKANTRRARYRILHNDKRTDQIINQARFHNQWVSLGTYAFDGNGQESVLLYDNTGEAEGSRQIAFDAIKFVRR